MKEACEYEQERMSINGIDCDEKVKEILRRCNSKLIEILEPDTLVDMGVENGLFKFVFSRDIHEKQSTSEKTRAVIDHIRKKGSSGYKIFKECLFRTRQGNVLTVLEKTEDYVLAKEATSSGSLESASEETMSVSEPSSLQTSQSACGSQDSDSSLQLSSGRSMSSISNDASQDQNVPFYLDPDEPTLNKRNANGDMKSGIGSNWPKAGNGGGDVDMTENHQKRQKLNHKPYADNQRQTSQVELAKETDEKVTINLKVYHISKKMMSNKKSKPYFNVVAAEGSSFFYLRIYLKDKISKIKEGIVYKFHNARKKYDNELWVIGDSKVVLSEMVVEIDGNLKIPLLPENAERRTLEDALKTREKSTVCGKIVKVSAVKIFDTSAVRYVLLKDNSSVVKLVLFSDNAEMEFSIGAMLKVTPVCKDGSERQQLSGRYSVCERVPDQPNITITDSDLDEYIEDHAFCDVENMEEWSAVSLTALNHIDIYDCCQNPACKKKKMKDGQCPVCGASSTNNLTSIRAVFLGSTPTGEMDTETTLFQSNLQRIFGLGDTKNKVAIRKYLEDQLPIKLESRSCGQCLKYIQYRKA